MTKFTDTQLCILSKAAQRDDGAVMLPEHVKGGAAQAVTAKLIDGGLVEEVEGGPDLPVWRRDEEGRPVALRITKAGLKAIGIEEDGPVVEGDGKADIGSTPEGADRAEEGRAQGRAAWPRAGSKQGLLIEMLAREGGASMDELTAATGWLPHTTRAALSGLRKKGHAITRAKREDGKTAYRICSRAPDAGHGSGASYRQEA
jgi:hypothetical protein